MAVTTTISLQSQEHRSSKSEIRPQFEAQMAAMNNNNNNSSVAPLAMETGSTSELRVGKSCHQCRQKFYSVAPDCHNTERVRKLCQIKYCTRCLWNRYREKTEEVMLLPNWECPLCRGICNCSQCMKKNGRLPTGKMTVMGGSKKGDKERKAERPRKIDENVGGELPPALKLPFASAVSEPSMLPALAAPKKPEPPLPRGVELTMVKSVPIPTEDVGNAMQFVKFCSTFGEILDFEQEPETILSIIFHGQPEEIAPVVLFQIQLLTVIMDPHDNPPLDPVDGDRCWLRSLNDCISQSELRRVGLPLNLINNTQYAAVSSSERLRILVLLCDECLQTKELRDGMEAMNDAFINRAKEARHRFRAAKEKEEELHRKMQARDEKDKNSDSPPIPENGDAAEDVQADPSSIRAEIAESQALLARYKRVPEALRVEPLFIDTSDSGALVYWRMDEGSPLLRQELHGSNPEERTERWYAYCNMDAKLVEEHIAINRAKRRLLQRKVEEVEVSSYDEDPPESTPESGPSQLEPELSKEDSRPSKEDPRPS